MKPFSNYENTQTFSERPTLPAGGYVAKIKKAVVRTYKNGEIEKLEIAFDIAEGEYKDFYNKQFQQNTSEDKKWPNDAVYRLGVPDNNSQSYVWNNWNTFFADLEDSNNGFVFAGDCRTLKGKLIGGKFAIEQDEYKGNVYDHTRLRWTCVADDIRSGNAGKMPSDKLITQNQPRNTAPAPTDENGFMSIPDGIEDEVPFI